MIQQWFRWWLGAAQVTSRYLNQWRLSLLTHICVTRPQIIHTAQPTLWSLHGEANDDMALTVSLFFSTLSCDFRPLTVISDDFRWFFFVKLSQGKTHSGRNRSLMLMRNGVHPRGFVFHRNHSLSLVISGIQTQSSELRSARASMMDSVFTTYMDRWLTFIKRNLSSISLQWRHNGHDSVSNHQPHHCLSNRLFRRRSKKTSKLRVTGLWAGNSPGTGEFPAQMPSYAENLSIWWRHHDPTRSQPCGSIPNTTRVRSRCRA